MSDNGDSLTRKTLFQVGGLLAAAVISSTVASLWYNGNKLEQLRSDITTIQTKDIVALVAAQHEILARLDRFDTTGTRGLGLLEQRVAAQEAACAHRDVLMQDYARKLEIVQTQTLENKLRLESILEAISPHNKRLP